MRRALSLTPGRRPDFASLHAGAEGWCQCVAWWVESWEGWGARSEAQNRDLRAELFARGQDDGYLLYDAEGRALAWAQVGPRDRLVKLSESFGLAPDPGAWAIMCLRVSPDQRRRGHARALLEGILAALPGRGARRVEAFPKCGPDLEPGELWTGPERLYRELGFEPEGGRSPRPGGRRVYRKELHLS